MPIQSSKPDISRTVSPKMREEDIISEISLRPRSLEEYVGQSAIKLHLSVAIESAKIRKNTLEHILFMDHLVLEKRQFQQLLLMRWDRP